MQVAFEFYFPFASLSVKSDEFKAAPHLFRLIVMTVHHSDSFHVICWFEGVFGYFLNHSKAAETNRKSMILSFVEYFHVSTRGPLI